MQRPEVITAVSPLISVIVASYNYGRYLTQTLDSLIGQTYKNFEIIVIDDGSKDDSVDVIRDFQRRDARVKFVQHEDHANGSAKGLQCFRAEASE